MEATYLLHNIYQWPFGKSISKPFSFIMLWREQVYPSNFYFSLVKQVKGKWVLFILNLTYIFTYLNLSIVIQ